MENMKTNLIIEYQRLDLEFEVIRSLCETFKTEGKIFEADELEEAKKQLYQAIIHIKRAWKFLPDKSAGEQIKMDLDL